jgi:hypothetical protein
MGNITLLCVDSDFRVYYAESGDFAQAIGGRKWCLLDSSLSPLKDLRESNFLRFSAPGGGDRKVKGSGGVLPPGDGIYIEPFAKVVA